MSTSTSVRSRLERYTIMASVPTVGIMGSAALAAGGDDFFHYGGPAIVLERGNFTSGTAQSGDQFWSRSFSEVGLEPFPMKAFNGRNYENFGQGKSSWDIIQAGIKGSSDLQFGATSADGFGRMVAEGDVIDGAGFFAREQIRVASTQDVNTFYNQGITRNGDWALGEGNEDSEVRGFLSFIVEDDESEVQVCGWLDIGWDGDLLTIYDYAAFLGDSIEAGQTSSSTAVPGAGGLAALAMGAAGLRRRRKKSA